MKSRITFLTILTVSTAFVVSAQEVEFDDMYFRSKDREMLASSQTLTMRAASKELEVISPINPTDSYSARNVNPEYLSQTRVNPSSTQQNPVAYFIPGYVPTGVNQNIYNQTGYSNYNGMMMNPYSSFGMGMGMMPGLYNPYNSYYSNPWMGYDPYGYNSYGYNNPYGSGWSTSLSMSMGWGMGMSGFNSWGGSPWNNFYGMNSWGMNLWGMSGMGYGGGFYGYNSWYRPQVVIINGDTNARNQVYGKRSSRSNDLNNNVTTSNRQAAIVDSQGGTRGSSNGRVAGNENQAAGSYYQRGWRTNPETNSNANRSGWNNSNSGRSATDYNNAWNNSNNTRNNSNSSYMNNSRSSGAGNSNFSTGGGSTGGGSRSSSGSSTGSAGRGRN